MKSYKIVGQDAEKIDGPALVSGMPVFTDDFRLPGMLYGKILRSPLAHGLIKDIDTSKAESLPGVRAVFSYKNVPRKAYTTAGQGFPEPSPYDSFIFDKKVRFVGDRVAAVFADSLEIAEEGLSLIEVDFEELPPVFDPEESLKEGAPIIHDEPEIQGAYDPKRNIVSHVELEIGEVDRALRESDYFVEGTWETQYAQHCPMETHVAIAYLDDRGRLVVRSSTQVPFHARRILSAILGIPISQIRVVKPRIGGGFGAKQEVLIEDLVALATLKTRRPSRIELTREEEFVSSRTMHPMKVTVRLGANKDGMLQAIDMDILSNTGAYGTHGPTVFFNAGSKTLPLYNKAPNVRFTGNVVYTNLPVAGAYRGYGATEGYFALECAMDELAKKMGIDPLHLRDKNHIRPKESSPIFKKLGEGREGVPQIVESCGLEECIEKGASVFHWEKKKSLPREIEPGIFRGYGMAIMMQGSAIPLVDLGSATIKMNEDGSFLLLVGATDLGTGSDTILAQIACEELGVPLERMTVYSSDTDFTPFDKGAYASSTTYISGEAVRKAARKVKEQILEIARTLLSSSGDLLLEDGQVKDTGTGKAVSLEEIGLRSFYMADQRQIQASASHVSEVSPPPFAAHFVEVEVDTRTGKITPILYVASVDCGVAVNPQLTRGQIIGSIVNGLGFALSEGLIFNSKGSVLNANFLDYKVLSSLDVPDIEVLLVETHEPSGPFGAKSVAEVCINGPLPAVANAVYDALGIQLKKAPFTPEEVLRLLGKI
ncbi:MAG: molybdopterin-dependent oxidoreductase [Caldiserica bacterium]|jgi:CO/xanthine dehydrogenase Mo-binding subunit|nr:molybdopterin-dependent oxidoreductase [Caldisericota bacterium]MDH7562673.1 molybdopterin-dependent oxidoreductase [Caldisericota bacterium]